MSYFRASTVSNYLPRVHTHICRRKSQMSDKLMTISSRPTLACQFHFPTRENNLQLYYSQAQFYMWMMMARPKHGWDIDKDHFRGFIQTNSTNSYTHFQPTLSQNTHAPHNSKKLQSLPKLHKFHQKSHPTAIHSKRDRNVKVHHQCHRTARECKFQATLYWKKILPTATSGLQCLDGCMLKRLESWIKILEVWRLRAKVQALRQAPRDASIHEIGGGM